MKCCLYKMSLKRVQREPGIWPGYHCSVLVNYMTDWKKN